MSKKEKVEDYAKTHDSVMNNIESILSCLYDIEYLDYCDTEEYEKASGALFEFFYSLSKEKKECED